ncbi:MAG: MBL fold metallo-hydrolase [Euryarchaeota archaeon]|nr:MBL fold metallo-hydrolase [Euryarchaeota archaeon]
MEIIWHGHACFEIRTSGKTIVIDPHDGVSLGIYPPRTKADIVLVTHDHFDHNAVRAVSMEGTVVYREAKNWTEISEGIKIKTITVPHDKSGGSSRGLVNAFMISSEGIEIAHLGDIGDIPNNIGEFEGVDILMIPVGGYYTIEPEEAKELVDKVRPRVVIPMHYKVMGLALNIKPVEEFLRHYEQSRIVRVGRSVEVSRKILDEIDPSTYEIWVFSL